MSLPREKAIANLGEYAETRWHFNGGVLEERYLSGGSSRSLGAVFGCSHSTILRNLHKASVAVRPGGRVLEGKWSLLYERCRKHKGTDIPHHGWGLCWTCYKQEYRRGRVGAF